MIHLVHQYTYQVLASHLAASVAAPQTTIHDPLSIRHVLTVPHDYTCQFQHADLLRIQSLPAWPAAGTVLIRCINALGGPKGLQHPDASVRQISVDLLGLIAAQLYKDALTAEDNQAWLMQFAASDGEPLQSIISSQTC